MVGPYKDKTPRLGRDVFVAPSATVIGDVSIGDFSSVWFNAVVRGDVHRIRIGRYTNVQDSCVLHVTVDKFPLSIGDRVTIGHGCILHGCKLADECLIGMGAVILDNVELGERCIVGAGSVITSDVKIPPRTVVMGVPARPQRELNKQELEMLEQSAKNYVDLSREYLNSGR